MQSTAMHNTVVSTLYDHPCCKARVVLKKRWSSVIDCVWALNNIFDHILENTLINSLEFRLYTDTHSHTHTHTHRHTHTHTHTNYTRVEPSNPTSWLNDTNSSYQYFENL